MKALVALVLAVYVLLYVLELLGALYRSFVRGHQEDLEEAVKKAGGKINILNLPLVLRALFVTAVSQMGRLSLLFHEVMHAGGQLLSGGRPRVVLCRNGGYAASRPWSAAPPMRLGYFYGDTLMGGVTSMAPLLGGAALLYAVAWWTTPLDANFVGQMSELLEEGAAATPGIGLGKALLAAFLTTAKTLVSGAWWGALVVLLVTFVLGSSLTPSSTDFSSSRYELLAYGLVILVAGAVYLFAPKASLVLLGIGAFFFVAYHVLYERTRNWPKLVGTTGMGLLVVVLVLTIGGLGGAPVAALQRGVSFMVFLLVFTAVVYAATLATMVILSVLTFDLGPIWLMLKNLPSQLVDAFRTFDTCDDCGLHFHGSCDGCNRTIAQIEADLAARPNALEAAKQKLGA